MTRRSVRYGRLSHCCDCGQTTDGRRIRRGLCPLCYERTRRVGLLGALYDPVAVERLVAGTFTGIASCDELHAAIDRLDGYGWSARQIATRLGCHQRTVQRHRNERREAAA
jgi:hypothetical protein